MKKNIVLFICSIFMLLPSFCFAKKVTCSNGDYSATVEIDKEKVSINEKAFISVTSDSAYEVSYKEVDKKLIEVSEDGIIKANLEGKTSVNVEVEFISDNKVVGSCKVDLDFEIVSNDSSLKMLTLEEVDISHMFQTDKYDYVINLPYNFEKINIVAEANNKNAKITGEGRRYINEGNNEYEIIVTATDGTTSTYKIVINREDASDDATLKNLIVEGYVLTPKFNKDTYNYRVDVPKDIEDITIKAEATYEYALVKGEGKHTLASGENTYKIVVTAQNGSESTYELIVNKNKGSSKLKSLVITDHYLDSSFASDKYTYYLTVNSNINKLDIKAEAVDNDQVEIIGNEELEIGNNEIIIRVTGEDKSATTYKLNVNKLSAIEEEKIEKNNNLLKILLNIFVLAFITMLVLIGIFIKRNYKRKIKIKK